MFITLRLDKVSKDWNPCQVLLTPFLCLLLAVSTKTDGDWKKIKCKCFNGTAVPDGKVCNVATQRRKLINVSTAK